MNIVWTFQADQLCQLSLTAAGLLLILRQLRCQFQQNALLIKQLQTNGRQLAIQNQQLAVQQNMAASDLLFRFHQEADRHRDLDQLLRRRRARNFCTPMKDSELYAARLFLRFCETVTIALERGVVCDEEVFRMLAFRMFLAIEDPCIKRKLLCNGIEPQFAFSTVFGLHDRLLEYVKARCPNWRKELAGHGVPEQNLATEVCYREAVAHYKRHHQDRSRASKQSPHTTHYFGD